MLHAISHRRSSDDEPFGTLILDSANRHLHRKMLVTNQGDELAVDLPEAVLLADGDRLVLEDGRTIEIIAAKEKLYEVRAGGDVPLLHLAWHLGSRHLAAQISEERILIRRDHAAREMLTGLGAEVTETIEAFQPASEIHHHVHDHHEHDHGHHKPDPGRAVHGKSKPDRYGRLPGDPHYGHNHG